MIEQATRAQDTAAGTVGGAREAIPQAAVELIARDGFDGVRIADIAARAGVSTALVHYHFTGRDRLLTGALAHSLTRADARRLAAGRLALAGHHDRDLPFQPLPDPGTAPADLTPQRATPRRRAPAQS